MIFKQIRTGNFTTIQNDLLEIPTMSFAGKGLLIYLLSKPANWIPNRIQLANVGLDGERAIRTLLQELENNKFLYRSQVRSKDGKGFVWNIVVFDNNKEYDKYVKKHGEPVKFMVSIGAVCTDTLRTDTPRTDTNRSVLINKELINTELINKEKIYKKENSEFDITEQSKGAELESPNSGLSTKFSNQDNLIQEAKTLENLSDKKLDLEIVNDTLSPPAEKKVRKVKEKLGTRIPDDFTISDSIREWFKKQNFPFNLEYEFDSFKDYWFAAVSAKAVKKDWDAAFRTWCRKSLEYKNKEQKNDTTKQSKSSSAARLFKHLQESSSNADN